MRNPIIAGERVYLRPLEASDATVLALGRHQETETFFDVGRVPYSEIAYEQWIEQLCAQQPPEAIGLAICLTDGDEVIGMTGADNLDWINRTGETEIYLSSPAHRGQGYGTEGKQLLLEYLFDRLQLEVISSFILEMNRRSAESVLRQGYRPAGRIRTLLVHEGRFHHVLVFDLTREEWRAAREQWRVRRSS